MYLQASKAGLYIDRGLSYGCKFKGYAMRMPIFEISLSCNGTRINKEVV